MRAHPGHETRSQRQSTQCLPAELQEIEPDLAGACIQALPACVGKPPLRHLCLRKTSSAAEILVITDPNADRNKIEI